MHFCLIYDCLYPYTVGGAERWYRTLSLELAAEGHQVTYLTRRQWGDGPVPDLDGVEVVGVAAGGSLYDHDGRRTITSPIRFAFGVFGHLLRNRGRYDVIHCGNFPYFPLLAVALAAPRTERGVDWHEVWTRGYWRGYLGGVGGRIGHAIQRVCIHQSRRSFVFHDLQARRLREEGFRGELIRLEGLYDGPHHAAADADAPRDPLVVFAGRHIPEKRATALPAAVAAARGSVPGLRAIILGDGPEHGAVLEAVRTAGVEEIVETPGFVSADQVHSALERASCHVLPSLREGYGMVVVEAAAAGTPSVVVNEPDNAAAELVVDGVNGFVVQSLDDLPAAIVRVHEAGTELRATTARWFRDNADALSASESARRVAAAYTGKPADVLQPT